MFLNEISIYIYVFHILMNILNDSRSRNIYHTYSLKNLLKSIIQVIKELKSKTSVESMIGIEWYEYF